MDDYIDSEGEVSTTKKRNDLDADNVPVSVSEEEEAQMESEDAEKDSEEEVPCMSPPVYDDNDDDNDDNEEDDDDNNDGDDEEDVCDFDLNDVKGMPKYKVLRLQRIHMNNAKLASLVCSGARRLPPPHLSTAPIERNVWRRKVILQGEFLNQNAMYVNQHLTRILMSLSSARKRVPLILLTRERRILSARGRTRTRRSTAQAAQTTRRTTTTRTSWRTPPPPQTQIVFARVIDNTNP